MTERHLTFAEVQKALGLSPDEVRRLMESKALHGVILEGVIQFRESEVMRLRGAGGAKGGGGRTDEDMGLVFLVDEDEEKEIEGEAYDGEELVTPQAAAPLAPGEEVMEPVELSEEQLRNSELLGTDSVVDFGREVVERTREQEFGEAQLAEGEEILEPSEVELPEPEFGMLSAAVPEAAREEPAEEETPLPLEAEAAPFEEEPVTPTVEAEEPVETGLVAEVTEIAEGPSEEPVEAVAAEEAHEEGIPEEAETKEVAFTLEREEEPSAAEEPQEELTFAEEEAGPAAYPLGEEGEAAPARKPEPVSEVPTVPADEPPELTFEEEEAEPMACPVEPEAEEVPAAELETVEEHPVGEAVEEAVAGPTPAAEGEEIIAAEPVAGEPVETFEVAEPEPVLPVTESLERAVDEEVADLEGEAEVPAVEEVAAREVPAGGVSEAPEIELAAEEEPEAEAAPVESEAEAVWAAPSEEMEPASTEPKAAEISEIEELPAAPVLEEEKAGVVEAAAAATAAEELEVPAAEEEVPEVAEAPEEEPVEAEAAEPAAPHVEEEVAAGERGREAPVAPLAAAAFAAEGTKDVFEEAEAELAAEEAQTEETAARSDEGAIEEFEETGVADSERSREIGVRKLSEEAEPVTDERKDEGAPEQPEEEVIPLADEGAKPEPPGGEVIPLLGEEETEEAVVPQQPAETPSEAPAAAEGIEVFDLEEEAPPAEEAEEELVTLEEEAPAEEAAATKDRTLEQEMAELFDEEAGEAPPDEAFAAPAEEDFDLSVFQQDVATEEPVPVTEEGLFEMGAEAPPAVAEQPVAEAPAEVEGVSRIRALTEERTAPSTAVFTATVLLAFLGIAFTAMLLWHIFFALK